MFAKTSAEISPAKPKILDICSLLESIGCKDFLNGQQIDLARFIQGYDTTTDDNDPYSNHYLYPLKVFTLF